MKNHAKTHELRRSILKSLADNNLNACAVARELHYHHHAIEYHCRGIQRDTGLNPKCFYDMIKLLKMYKIPCEGEGATANEGASTTV